MVLLIVVCVIIIRLNGVQAYNALKKSFKEIASEFDGEYIDRGNLEGLKAKFDVNRHYDVTIKTIIKRKRKYTNQYSIRMTIFNSDTNLFCFKRNFLIKDAIDNNLFKNSIRTLIKQELKSSS